MIFKPNYQTTLIGSVPYQNINDTCKRIISFVDIPVWPQMVKISFQENMYTQYSSVLPSIMIDEGKEKIMFNTKGDLISALELFYSHYLEEDVEFFGLKPSQAAGFFAMMKLMENAPGEWMKGQVTGPVSMGLTVTDQDLRASLYHEELMDVLVKNAAMNARWQIQKMMAVRPGVIIFVDEPYMASFGSAYISLSREQVIAMLDEIFEAIQAEGALAGVHCCANTDWSVLLSTRVDILNLDAYGFIDNLALYPKELKEFLDRGGIIAWGIVPNNQDIYDVTIEELKGKLEEGIDLICRKATARGVSINPGVFNNQSLITPACGLGSTTPEVADKVLRTSKELGELLRS